MSLPSLDGDEKGNKKESPMSSALPSLDASDDFEDVDVEDVLNEEDEENQEIYHEANKADTGVNETSMPLPNEYEEDYYASEEDYNPDYEEDLENEGENKFIDKEKKRLIPFGGDKSKRKLRKIKSSDFDDRKNTLSTTKIVRFVVMMTLLLMFIFGIKNTFWPSHVYTSEQIENFARVGAGQTEFPKEEGETFVKNFTEVFLTMNPDKPETKDILSYFYGEGHFDGVGYDKINMRPGKDVVQDVIMKPEITKSEMLTDYSALFEVSTYVTDVNGRKEKDSRSTGRWLTFSINVYYDKDTQALAITPDSPTIVPSNNVMRQKDVPDRAPFGNGEINTDIAPAINPTINGFVEAYAKASIESHESILQYLTDKNDVELHNGFGGAVRLNGEPEDAIKRTIYNGDDDIYRVELEIDWVDTVSENEENLIEYRSKYIMRVNDEGNGKYSISSFVPYTFYTH